MAKSPVEKDPASKAKTGAKAKAESKAKSAPAAVEPVAAAAPAEAETGKLIFDGNEYPFDKLSEEARNNILNLQGCDHEIGRLKVQMAIAQTARMAYAAALKQALAQS